jgi:hypothetical protein
VEGAGSVKLYSRRNNSFNKRFPQITHELEGLTHSAVLQRQRQVRKLNNLSQELLVGKARQRWFTSPELLVGSGLHEGTVSRETTAQPV